MEIRTTKFDGLTADDLAAWSAIQRANSIYASPYFRPEFTRLVAAVCPDVEAAVIEANGAPVAFFPFQRSRFNSGVPVGSIVNDFQGVIATQGVEIEPRELLRACRLSSWRFDHLVPGQAAFDRCAWISEDSTYMELSGGLDEYLAGRSNASTLRHEYRRKKRRLQKENGLLCYEHHVADPAILDTCIEWKIDQYRRTNMPNIFRSAWVARLLHKILAYQKPEFAGVLSVCYAGDRIAAINFGMQSGNVFHSWFPAYNQEMSAASPGFLCWMELISRAASLGIRRVDFGKGSEGYKSRLMTGAMRVSEGAAHARQTASVIGRACWSARKQINQSLLGRPARALSRNVRHVRQWLGAKFADEGRFT